MLFFLLICLYLLFRLSQGPYKENIFWPYIIKICLLAIFIGRTDAEAEAKDPDAGKDRKQEEKGMTEDKMVGWHH